MRRECIIFFMYFLKFFKIYYLAGVISLWPCNWRLFAKKKSYKIYRSFKRSYIETYFTIIEIGISISLAIIPDIFVLCWIFLFYICVRFCQFNFFPRCGWFFLWLFSLFMFFILLIFCFYIFYSVLKMNLYCFSAVLSNETGNHFVHYNFLLAIWNDSGVEANPHFDWEKNLYILP